MKRKLGKGLAESSLEGKDKIRCVKIRLFLKWLGLPQWGNNYHCTRCGCLIPKRTPKQPLGYDSEHSLRHIHCPKCGKIIYVAN